MEVLNSSANNHRKFRYSKMHGEEQDDFQDRINRQQNTRWHRILIPTLSIICLSLIGLLISTRHFRHNRECNCSNMNDVGSNLLANDGLSIINKIAIPYHYLESEFDVDDFALSDPSWANMFPVGGGIVFLTQEYITSRRIPFSAISPNRPGNRSVYEIAGYHSLHCLTALRANLWRAKKALQGGEPYDIEKYWYHTVHCLADLRQYIMCNFDETLLYVKDLVHHPGQEQLKLCKQIGPINNWLEENYGAVE